MSALCPKPTVKKPGSGRSPGTLENEKLPFAMRLRYYSLNGPYAASTAVHDDVEMRFVGLVLGPTSRWRGMEELQNFIHVPNA
jgi:hypothetical protein